MTIDNLLDLLEDYREEYGDRPKEVNMTQEDFDELEETALSNHFSVSSEGVEELGDRYVAKILGCYIKIH